VKKVGGGGVKRGGGRGSLKQGRGPVKDPKIIRRSLVQFPTGIVIGFPFYIELKEITRKVVVFVHRIKI
jgi:hypothetical protein